MKAWFKICLTIFCSLFLCSEGFTQSSSSGGDVSGWDDRTDQWRLKREVQIGDFLTSVTLMTGFAGFLIATTKPRGSVEKRPTGVSQNRPTDVARDKVLLSFFLLVRQACFCSPAPRPAFEDMAMMEEAVEHSGDGRAVAEQFSPVLHRAVGG